MSEWEKNVGNPLKPALDMLEDLKLKLGNFKPIESMLVIAVLIVLGVLNTSWFTVQPEETGIVQRFGKVVRTADPGLHFKLPLGIEIVRRLPTARALSCHQFQATSAKVASRASTS